MVLPIEGGANGSLVEVGKETRDDVGHEAVGDAGRGALDEVKGVA